MLEARRAGRILFYDLGPPLKAKNHARIIILISCYSVTSCAPCLLQSNVFYCRVDNDLQHRLSVGTGSLQFMFISFDCNYNLESTDLSCPFLSNMDGTGRPLDGLDFMSHKSAALGFHTMFKAVYFNTDWLSIYMQIRSKKDGCLNLVFSRTMSITIPMSLQLLNLSGKWVYIGCL